MAKQRPLWSSKSRLLASVAFKNARREISDVLHEGRRKGWKRPEYVVRMAGGFLVPLSERVSETLRQQRDISVSFSDADRARAAARILRMGFMFNGE